MGFFIRDIAPKRRWDDIDFRGWALIIGITFVVCCTGLYYGSEGTESTVMCTSITGTTTVGSGRSLQVTEGGYSAIVKGHRQYYMKDINERCVSMDKEDYDKAHPRP